MIGVGHADAQSAGGGTVVTADCDQLATTTTTTNETNYSDVVTLTYYFADVPLTGVDPTNPPLMTAEACSYTYFNGQGNPLGFGCPASEPAGVTCNQSGFAWPGDVTCAPAAAYLGSGHAIVYCGYQETVQTNNNGTITNSSYGAAGTKVYLRY